MTTTAPTTAPWPNTAPHGDAVPAARPAKYHGRHRRGGRPAQQLAPEACVARG